MPGQQDLNIDAGATFRISFQWGTDDDGTLVPYDLTGCEAYMVVGHKSAYGKVSYSGTIDAQNKVTLEIAADETAEIPDGAEYYVEIVYPSGDERHVFEGTLTVSHEGMPK